MAGSDADRIKTNWYGEGQPVADNNTEEGRFLNRRVEFFITNSDVAESQR